MPSKPHVRPPRPLIRHTVVLTLCCVLAACGGSSGSDSLGAAAGSSQKSDAGSDASATNAPAKSAGDTDVHFAP